MKRSIKAFSVVLMSCALVGGFGTVGASAHTLSRHTPAINVVQPMPAQPGAPVVPVAPAPVAPAPVAPAPVAPAPVVPAPVAPTQPTQPAQGSCATGVLVITKFESDCYDAGDSDYVVGAYQITNNTTGTVIFGGSAIAPGASQTFSDATSGFLTVSQ
jgi:hypothetical protein